jgi:cation transporter-like permease
MPTLLIPIFVCFPSAMAALLCVKELVVIIPVIVNLQGNTEMNISTRLGTTKFNAPMLVEIGQNSAHSSAFTTSLSIPVRYSGDSLSIWQHYFFPFLFVFRL